MAQGLISLDLEHLGPRAQRAQAAYETARAAIGTAVEAKVLILEGFEAAAPAGDAAQEALADAERTADQAALELGGKLTDYCASLCIPQIWNLGWCSRHTKSLMLRSLLEDVATRVPALGPVGDPPFVATPTQQRRLLRVLNGAFGVLKERQLFSDRCLAQQVYDVTCAAGRFIVVGLLSIPVTLFCNPMLQR